MNTTVLNATIIITTVMESEICPTKFNIKIGLDFEDADPYHHAIGIERIRYLLNMVFNRSIFIDRNNPMLDSLKKMTSTRVAECWDDPWDQFVALMVMFKSQAVLEGKGIVDFVRVTGDSGDDLEHTYYADAISYELGDEDFLWLAEKQKKQKDLKTLWYHRSDMSLNEDYAQFQEHWDILGLDWDKTKNAGDPGPSEPITNNIRQFKPKIVE